VVVGAAVVVVVGAAVVVVEVAGNVVATAAGFELSPPQPTSTSPPTAMSPITRRMGGNGRGRRGAGSPIDDGDGGVHTPKQTVDSIVAGKAPTMTNRYLTGNFAPVTSEVTATDLPVTGQIPDSLIGRYLRNGPNPVTPPDPATYHWFTGTGMVHGVRLRDGRAEWYRNRWVRNRSVADVLGETWAGGPVHADMDAAPNTNVIGHAGRTLALVESGPVPYELTDELDTVGPTDLGGTLPAGYTAHPKLDPTTGELHAMAYWWGWGNQVQYIVIGADGSVTRTEDIATKGPTMMHDFSLTEGHVVVYDQPVIFDLDDAMNGASFPYRWDDDYGSRLGVMPRAGTAADVHWFDVDPCYVFHPMNAYDDGDRIVLDVVRHPRMFDRVRNGPDDGIPTLHRWTIDQTGRKVIDEQLDDRGQEFPRVDERRVSRRHRYGYAAAADDTILDGASASSGLLKHDLERGTSERHDFAPHAGPGEGVFVPSTPDAAEDDGYVMAIVYDPDRDGSDMVILAAQDFTSAPVARVQLPQRVPFGFHGNWVPDA
jgi:carotenoid cleavage dioxygenase-like enzyme